MKKLLFVFSMMFFAVGISTVNAQSTSCTPAQQAACKKICATSTSTSCTPAQVAACKKTCDNKTSTKIASTTEAKNPFVNVSAKATDTKATSSCASKLTSGKTKGCTASKNKVVKNENSTTTLIAQKVANKSDDLEE